mgnify:CR=1 FL=1
MGGAGFSTVEPEELEGVVALNELLFVYIVGGGPEPLVIWPGQIRSDVVAAGGHSIRGIESMHRVGLDSGLLALLARMKALNDETEGAVADLFAAIHAAGTVHAARQGAASSRR